MENSKNEEQKIEIYKKMLIIRRFEEKVSELFAQGLIPGFVHLYIGEEAVAVGVCENLRKDDYILSTHRGHGHCLAKGGEPKYMMAELFGKKTGYCKGKGGSMHIANFDKGILGASGVIGAAVEIATGAALSAKMRKTSQVAVCFFGDGASNRGPFHEAFNMAAIWKLPVIYVCENNLYAISERSSEYCASENIADRAVAYNMPGVIVDGNDVIEVYNAVGEAVERARKGGGPTLVECKTYRWRGHFEGEGVEVRPREEIEEWRSRCPIKRFRSELLETGVLTEDLANRLEEEARSKIEEAMDFAKESPFPAPEEAEEDLFA